jgi:hypothetical protein
MQKLEAVGTRGQGALRFMPRAAVRVLFGDIGRVAPIGPRCGSHKSNVQAQSRWATRNALLASVARMDGMGSRVA